MEGKLKREVRKAIFRSVGVYCLVVSLWISIIKVSKILFEDSLASTYLFPIVMAAIFVVIISWVNYVVVYKSILMIRDVKKELLFNEQIYKYVIKNTSLGLCEFNMKERTSSASPTLLKHLGYDDSSTTMTFEQWMNLIHIEDKEKVTKEFNDYKLKTKEKFIVNHRLKRKNDS